MTGDALRAAVHRAADLATDHLRDVGRQPVWQPVPLPDAAWLTGQPLPVAARSLDELLDDVQQRIMSYPMGNGHPRFFGWVNSPPSPAGVLVSPLAKALNPSCAGGDHAGVLLERTVLRWLAELVGYPHPPGGGLLTSGASMATITALAAARHRLALRSGRSIRDDGTVGHPPMTIYVSTEGHSCLRRAAELLGFGSRHVRLVRVDERYRMDVDALRGAIAADIAAGLQPCLIAASAGTANTGTVDPLDAVADVATEHDVWLHVDGAYGALGVLAPRAAERYSGMARADSLALDPHKWLGVPVDCGALLVRDPAGLRDTFSLVPPYLRDETADPLGWFAEYGPEQTRPFRALGVWATISHLGRDGIVDLVSRTTGLARTLGSMIEDSDDLELLAPVETSIVAFRVRPCAYPEDLLDDLNRAIPAAVQRRGRAFVTGTQLGGVAALRACILSAATTTDDLSILLDEVRHPTSQPGGAGRTSPRS